MSIVNSLSIVVFIVASFGLFSAATQYKEQMLDHQSTLPTQAPNVSDSTAYCELCELSVEAIKAGRLENLMQVRMEATCRLLLEQRLVDQCHQAVDGFMSDWNRKSTEEICEQIHLCPSHEKPTLAI